jgi:hypothetical protein
MFAIQTAGAVNSTGALTDDGGYVVGNQAGELTLVHDQRPAGTDDGEWTGRPCWVQLETGERPGQVCAWRKSATGDAWEGLLVGWVPAESLRPR